MANIISPHLLRTTIAGKELITIYEMEKVTTEEARIAMNNAIAAWEKVVEATEIRTDKVTQEKPNGRSNSSNKNSS